MITWDDVAVELYKLDLALERIRVACLSQANTWSQLTEDAKKWEGVATASRLGGK